MANLAKLEPRSGLGMNISHRILGQVIIQYVEPAKDYLAKKL